MITEISITKSTWCTFHPIYWESRVSTCFEHYSGGAPQTSFCIMSVDCGTLAVKLQPCHSRLTVYARNIPNAVCGAPPEVEKIMLEACRGPWFSINWMKSASRGFHYTDILWCTVSKTFRLRRYWSQRGDINASTKIYPNTTMSTTNSTLTEILATMYQLRRLNRGASTVTQFAVAVTAVFLYCLFNCVNTI
jgi:hypothetical protein